MADPMKYKKHVSRGIDCEALEGRLADAVDALLKTARGIDDPMLLIGSDEVEIMGWRNMTAAERRREDAADLRAKARAAAAKEKAQEAERRQYEILRAKFEPK